MTFTVIMSGEDFPRGGAPPKKDKSSKKRKREVDLFLDGTKEDLFPVIVFVFYSVLTFSANVGCIHQF